MYFTILKSILHGISDVEETVISWELVYEWRILDGTLKNRGTPHY